MFHFEVKGGALILEMGGPLRVSPQKYIVYAVGGFPEKKWQGISLLIFCLKGSILVIASSVFFLMVHHVDFERGKLKIYI
jgi:hypothetical protein